MREGKMNWIGGCMAGLLLWAIPGTLLADLKDILLQFQPYVSIQEEYTSNVNLTPKNAKDDYITTLYAGLRYSSTQRRPEFGRELQPVPTEFQKYGIDLDGRAGFVYYEKGRASNYLSLLGNLNTWYRYSNRLTFRLSDNLTRSDESRVPENAGGPVPVYISGTFVNLTDLYLAGTQRERSVWLANIVSPSLEYKFSKEGTVSLIYTNDLYNNQSSLSENSQGNFIKTRLDYAFNIRNAISLDYGYMIAQFDKSPDFTGHTTHGRYTYRFSPQTAVFGDYEFLIREVDSPGVDYYVNTPSVGIDHLFSPTLSGKARVGYFWYSPDSGKSYSGPVLDIILAQRTEKTTYTLTVQGGFTETYFTAENLGPTQYYRAIGTITHRLVEKMTASLSGTAEWDRSRAGGAKGTGTLANADLKDTIWTVNGSVAYPLLKWLNLSLILTYKQDHSNVSARDYNEFRGLVRVEARYL